MFTNNSNSQAKLTSPNFRVVIWAFLFYSFEQNLVELAKTLASLQYHLRCGQTTNALRMVKSYHIRRGTLICGFDALSLFARLDVVLPFSTDNKIVTHPDG